MATVIARRSICSATLGLADELTTQYRHWQLEVLADDALAELAWDDVSLGARSLAALDHAWTRAVAARGAQLPTTAADAGAMVTQVVHDLQALFATWQAERGLPAAPVVLLVERGGSQPGVDLWGMVAGTTPSMYEALSEHLSALASAQVADLRVGSPSAEVPAPAMHRLLATAWSDGVVFEPTGSAAAPALRCVPHLDKPDMAAQAAQALWGAFALIERLADFRTAPELRLSSWALAAAGVSRGAIEHLGLATGRVRIAMPALASAVFGLPVEGLGASTRYQATATDASTELFFSGGLLGPYVKLARQAVTGLVDEVLARAVAKTTDLATKGKDADVSVADYWMEAAQEAAEDLAAQVEVFAARRPDLVRSAAALAAAEGIVAWTQHEVRAGQGVIRLQESFMDEAHLWHDPQYSQFFRAVPLRSLERAGGLAHALYLLHVMRHGLEVDKPKLETNLLSPLADVEAYWKSRRDRLINWGPDRDMVLDKFRGRQGIDTGVRDSLVGKPGLKPGLKPGFEGRWGMTPGKLNEQLIKHGLTQGIERSNQG